MKFSVMFRLRLALALLLLGWARSLAAYTFPSVLSVGQKITAALINNIISTIAPCDSGTVTINIATANTAQSAAINFQNGRFTSPPLVFTQISGATNPQNVSSSPTNITAAGCTIYANRTAAGSVVVAWFAVVTP